MLEAAKTSKSVSKYKQYKVIVYSLSQGKRIGVFSKDDFTGEFVEGWKTALESSKFEQVRRV